MNHTPAPLGDMERFVLRSAPGEKPRHSPYGYLVLADGTVLSMCERWWHGVLLTLLFPDFAREKGYEPPTGSDDLDEKGGAHHYQRFELDYARELPVIRVALGVLGPTNVDVGPNITPPQREALGRVLRDAVGLRARDEVCTQSCDMTLAKFWNSLEGQRLVGEVDVSSTLIDTGEIQPLVFASKKGPVPSIRHPSFGGSDADSQDVDPEDPDSGFGL